jgi:hypothetical protein
VGADARIALTMGVALVSWSPAGLGLIRGSITFASAGVRLAIALLLAWIGVGILNRIVVAYGTANAIRDIESVEDEDRSRISIDALERIKPDNPMDDDEDDAWAARDSNPEPAD